MIHQSALWVWQAGGEVGQRKPVRGWQHRGRIRACDCKYLYSFFFFFACKEQSFWDLVTNLTTVQRYTWFIIFYSLAGRKMLSHLASCSDRCSFIGGLGVKLQRSDQRQQISNGSKTDRSCHLSRQMRFVKIYFMTGSSCCWRHVFLSVHKTVALINQQGS